MFTSLIHMDAAGAEEREKQLQEGGGVEGGRIFKTGESTGIRDFPALNGQQLVFLLFPSQKLSFPLSSRLYPTPKPQDALPILEDH